MREKIKALTSKRNRKLRYDFLPPMLEIMERPANPVGNILIWGIILIVLSTILWANMFTLDIAVTAQGYVMPKEELVNVKFVTTGIIEKIYVVDGDNVKKGDVILSTEQSQIELQLKDLNYNLEVMETQLEVYTRVKEETDVEETDVEEIDVKETDFEEADVEGTDVEEADVEWIDVEIYGENRNIAKAIITEYELYLCELKEYDRTSSRGEEYRNLRDSFIKEHELQILQNINSLEVKIHDTKSSIEKLEKQLDESFVKAPETGKITQLKYTVEGTAIQASENVCYIIPKDSTMQFEAYVSDADIKNIHLNDNVKVKLSLYKDTDNEIVNGVVTKISDVAVTTQNGGTCYEVDIELEETEGLIEHVGTAGVCDILVGTRSVLDYFMEPFRKGLKDSMKEY